MLIYSITQILDYSITHLLNYDYSITHILKYSNTQILQCSNAPMLNYQLWPFFCGVAFQCHLLTGKTMVQETARDQFHQTTPYTRATNTWLHHFTSTTTTNTTNNNTATVFEYSNATELPATTPNPIDTPPKVVRRPRLPILPPATTVTTETTVRVPEDAPSLERALALVAMLRQDR